MTKEQSVAHAIPIAEKTNERLHDNTPVRFELGEAWMFCSDCGAKLFSFYGDKDASQKCLKIQKYGRCG